MEMEVRECTVDDYFEGMDVVHLLCREVKEVAFQFCGPLVMVGSSTLIERSRLVLTWALRGG